MGAKLDLLSSQSWSGIQNHAGSILILFGGSRTCGNTEGLITSLNLTSCSMFFHFWNQNTFGFHELCRPNSSISISIHLYSVQLYVQRKCKIYNRIMIDFHLTFLKPHSLKRRASLPWYQSAPCPREERCPRKWVHHQRRWPDSSSSKKMSRLWNHTWISKTGSVLYINVKTKG